MPIQSTLSTLATIALAKCGEKMSKGQKIKPGVHNIDITALVRIRGTVTKGEDTDKASTSSIPLKTTLALCLEKAGIQRENIARILEESMTQALNLDEKGEEHIKPWVNDIDAAMGRVQKIIDKLPRTPVAGAIRTDLFVEAKEVTLEPSTVEA